VERVLDGTRHIRALANELGFDSAPVAGFGHQSLVLLEQPKVNE
jgi:hypothetical protein